MQCTEVLDLLSAYHDGELAFDRAVPVEAHLAECESCRRELASFQRLSDLATHLRTDDRPQATWREIQPQLAGHASRITTPPRRQSLRRRIAIAVTSAAVLGLVLVWWSRPRHDHLAADFDEFLNAFAQDVETAQSVLISHYDGRPTTIDGAGAMLQYEPLVRKGMPNGFSLRAAYLFKMPCCTCMEAVYEREDGSCVCVFEHNADQPIWFGSRPAIDTHCRGVPTRLVEVDGRLAATFRHGRRFITLIGAQGIDEVTRIVAALSEPGRT